MAELEIISISSPLAYADFLSQFRESMNLLLILISMMILVSSIFWLTYTLLKKHQLKIIAIQKRTTQSQLELKVEYQKLINLYDEQNHDDLLDRDFNTLMNDTFRANS